MATRLILLCTGATATSRAGGFPTVDEPLDEGGLRKAEGRALGVPFARQIWSSPARAARETATALRIEGPAESALADIDHGNWSGRSLADLGSDDPEALARWLADPSQGAPGGETMAQVVDRVGAWLDRQADADDMVIGVTHAAVIRASLAHALRMPLRATFQIDIAPLSVTILSFNRIWRLQELRPL
ncbi:histidine phosphatase family protein [soil metagenome]